MNPAAFAALLALQWFGGQEPNTREGVGHLEAGRLEEAMRAFSRARDAHPEAVESDLNIAGVHYRMGEVGAGFAAGPESGSPFAEAVRGYRAALAGGASGPARRDGFFNLGNALYRMEAFREAAAAYAEAIALDPEDLEARQNLERALRRAEEEQRAEQSPSGEQPQDPEEGGGEGSEQDPQPPQEQPAGDRPDQEEQTGDPPPPQPEESGEGEQPGEEPEMAPTPTGAEGETEAGSVPEISPEQAERILAALAEIERAYQQEQLEKRRARALRRGRH